MAYKNYKQVMAIQAGYRKVIKEICPDIDNGSGIYFLTRTDENNINYFYIGQSLHIENRMLSHCTGFQHIDLSVKRRGWYSEENPYGWKLNFIHYPAEELDKWEQYWILEYTKKGYQARYNKTAGGQLDKGEKINEYRPQKGYRDGIRQGKITLARELKHIIDKHLTVALREDKQNNKVSQQAFEKFNTLLDEESYKE